jgi:hypothetical protein
MAVLKIDRVFAHLLLELFRYYSPHLSEILSGALVAQFLALILFLRESNKILLPLPLIVGTEIGISANLQV